MDGPIKAEIVETPLRDLVAALLEEVKALRIRVEALERRPTYPQPNPTWPYRLGTWTSTDTATVGPCSAGSITLMQN